MPVRAPDKVRNLQQAKHAMTKVEKHSLKDNMADKFLQDKEMYNSIISSQA